MNLEAILEDDEDLAPLLPHHRELIRSLALADAAAVQERVMGLGPRNCGCVPDGAFPKSRAWVDFDREYSSSEPGLRIDGEKRVRKWLYECGVPFAREVIVADYHEGALAMPWKVFVRYWPRFLGDVLSDFYAVDRSVSWMLGCCHERILSFGSQEP